MESIEVAKDPYTVVDHAWAAMVYDIERGVAEGLLTWKGGVLVRKSDGQKLGSSHFTDGHRFLLVRLSTGEDISAKLNQNLQFRIADSMKQPGILVEFRTIAGAIGLADSAVARKFPVDDSVEGLS